MHPNQDRGKQEFPLPLVDAHLIRVDERRGVAWFELTHDRLIAPILSDNEAWIDANLSTLQQQARLWEKQGRPNGALLRGDALQKAEASLNESNLNGVELTFLNASRGLRDIEDREREQTRLLRQWAVATFIVACLAVVLAGIAFFLYFQADQAFRDAERVTQENNSLNRTLQERNQELEDANQQLEQVIQSVETANRQLIIG
ncbi:MAG: hypothetical protein HC828_18905 [Blastochloris sp.]|nr:hypothetical protein [Blastochloris sp.]